MNNNDYWTHICIVIIAFFTTVLPGSLIYGFTGHTLIYLGGAITVILVATIWKFLIKE